MDAVDGFGQADEAGFKMDILVRSCIVLGTINMDLRAEMDGKELRTGNTSSQPLLGKFFLVPGGKGACEAIAVALLGVPTTMVARIGGDVLGEDLLKQMEEAGVDISCVKRDADEATGVAVQLKMNSSGQKTHVICPGANLRISEDEVRDVLVQQIAQSETSAGHRPVLLMQMELDVAPMLAAMHTMRERGCEIALRAAPLNEKNKLSLEQMLAVGIDYLMLGCYEAPTLLGAKIGYNATLGFTMPLATVGEAASAATLIMHKYPQVRVLVISATTGHFVAERSDGETCTTYALPERFFKIVDEISTPDAFCGALIAAHCRGLTLGEALLWAQVAYQLARAVVGAQQAMPRLASVEAFIKMMVHQPMAALVAFPDTYLAQSELHLAIVYADVSRLVAALLDRTLQELGELISSKDAFGLTPVERAADMVMLCGTPTPVTQPLECLRLVIGAHLMLATTKHAPPPPRARLPQLVLDVAKEEVIPVSQSTAEVEELFHIAFGMPHPANLEDAAAQAMLLLLQGGANAHWRTEQLLGMSASLWARWRTVEDTRGWPEAGFAVAKRLCTPLLQAGAADSGPITRALLSARTIEGVSFASLLFTTPEDAIREVVVAASKRQSHWAEKMPLFWFLDADKLRSLSEEEVSVMRFRTLQELQRDDPSWIVEKRIDWEGAVCGEYEDEYAACSHRWETPEHPDPDGIQLKTLWVLLQEHPRIKWLWYDYPCMPQGKQRTAGEQAYFGRAIDNMDVLYVGCTVFALPDITYPSRFWTQIEFWLSMQDCSLNGLSTRSGLTATGGGRAVVRAIRSAGEQTVLQMIDMWKDKTPHEAAEILGSPDVQVTNGKDKTIFLPKVAELDAHVAEASASHATWYCGVMQTMRERASLPPCQREPPTDSNAVEYLETLLKEKEKHKLSHASLELMENLAVGYAAGGVSLATHCKFWCGDLLMCCPPLQPALAPATDDKKRAAIFFSGTFSPVHLGHLQMVKAAEAHLKDVCGYAEVVVYFSPNCNELERDKMNDSGLVGTGVQPRARLLHLAGCHVDLCEALLFQKNYEGSRAAFAARVPRGWEPFVMVGGDHARLERLKEKMLAGIRVFCVERHGEVSTTLASQRTALVDGACLELKKQADALGLGGLVYVHATPLGNGEASSTKARQLVSKMRGYDTGGKGGAGAVAAALWEQELHEILPPKVAKHISDMPALYACLGGKVHDVCIVGSGPIGLLLAVTLAERGQRVLLLDSASADQKADQAIGNEMSTVGANDTESIYGGELAGDVRRQWPEYLTESRARTFGGTSNLWGGWCPRLDPIDHEERTLSGGVPCDGWGEYLAHAELASYYDLAECLMEEGADVKRQIAKEETPLHGVLRDWSASTLLSTFPTQFQPKRLGSHHFPIYGRVRFQDLLKKRLRHPLIKIEQGVHALQVLRDGDRGAIQGVKAVNMNSGTFDTVVYTANKFVLAAGGIETPRLLKNSEQLADLPMYESIGSCFATHPLLRKFATVTFDLNGPHKELLKYTALEFKEMKRAQTRGTFHGPNFRWSPKRELLEEEGLPNFEILTKPGDTFLEDGAAKVSLHYEQPYCSEHHLGRSSTRDKFGMWQPKLTLGITKKEREWLARIQAIVKEDLLGCGIVTSVEFPKDILDAPADDAAPAEADAHNEVVLGRKGYHIKYLQHHLGTARMSLSPDKGVVNGQCCVHGLDNLYIAGTAVFPSGGHGNPTLTALALTLRLADHLQPKAVVQTVGDSLGAEQDKFAEMLLGSDSKLYGVPFSARHLLCYDPQTETSSLVGELSGMPPYTKGNGLFMGGYSSMHRSEEANKSRGARAAEPFRVILIPFAADTLMYFDRRSDDDDATPPPTSFGPSFGMKRGKWRCGAVAPNGKLYCVPHEATRFLCVHPESLEVEEVGQPVLDEDGSKFFGAVTGNDGMLYCCPYSASHVYRFNPMTDLVEKVGADLGDMEKKFSGGCMGPDGDTIYFVPNNAPRVYSFNVRSCQGAQVGPDLNAICGVEKSKFNGGVLGKDGALYLIPRDAPRVVRFDLKTRLAEPIGPMYATGGNKWAGGRLGADGHIYCAPHDHTHVLRICINHVQTE